MYWTMERAVRKQSKYLVSRKGKGKIIGAIYTLLFFNQNQQFKKILLSEKYFQKINFNFWFGVYFQNDIEHFGRAWK